MIQIYYSGYIGRIKEQGELYKQPHPRCLQNRMTETEPIVIQVITTHKMPAERERRLFQVGFPYT